MLTLSNIPYWYWILALVVTAYQTYRGYRLQALLGVGIGSWSESDRRWLLCVADAFTYFVCSMSGFYALLLAFRAATDPATDSVLGHPASLIFLVLYGVMGITAKLPDALNKLQPK